MEMERFDIVIVGAGMIGSASAKHISQQNKQLRVALVGPSEPKDRSSQDILSSHYDEGRVTRVADPDSTWARLAERSINRYRQIEEQSGIHFYDEIGFLCVAPNNSKYINNVKKIATEFGQDIALFDDGALKAKFPYMSFEQGSEAVYSTTKAGVINPRRLVEAQTTIAAQTGVVIFDDVIDSIEPSDQSDGGNVLRMARGRTLEGAKVLLATGAFTSLRGLLPSEMRPDFHLNPAMDIRVEVEEKDLSTFEGMPSVIYEGSKDMCYFLPPVKYPDGKLYLKLGSGGFSKRIDETDLHNWLCHGRKPQLEEEQKQLIQGLFPDLKMDRYNFNYCVTTHTSTGQVYVDMATPTIGVAIGGCGYAAKSSDEIGLMAAKMILNGSWDYDLPGERFKLRTQGTPSSE